MGKYSIDQILEMGVNKDIIDRLIEKLKVSGAQTNIPLVPFIGAGISCDYGLPLWKDLLLYVANIYFPHASVIKNLLKQGAYLKAADCLYEENPIRFKECLVEKCSCKNCDFSVTDTSAYYIAQLFNKSLVVTTNYDQVLEKVYERFVPSCKYKVDTPNAAGRLDNMLMGKNNNKSIIYKFHGDCESSNQEGLIITGADYDKLYNENSKLLSNLKELALKYNFFFLGSSLNFDALEQDRFLQLVDSVSENKGVRHFAILPFDIDDLKDKNENNSAMRKRYNNMLKEHKIEAIFFPNGDYDCVKCILKYIYEKVHTDSVESKKIDKVHSTKPIEKTRSVKGSLLVYGMNSCTLYEIIYQKGSQSRLKDRCRKKMKFRYSYSCPQKGDVDSFGAYEDELIRITKEKIIPYIRGNFVAPYFTKIVADPSFKDLDMPFGNKQDMDSFVERFYAETNLFFNVLDRSQIRDNLSEQFCNKNSKSMVIVDIGSTTVEVYPFLKDEELSFDSITLEINATEIKQYMADNNIDSESLSAEDIRNIKKYVKDKIKPLVGGITAEVAVILKDEATFMKTMGYDYRTKHKKMEIDMKNYKSSNRKIVFAEDYEKKIDEYFTRSSEDQRNIFKGYRNGHLILEPLFELLNIQTIIPSDFHSIHGNAMAYVSNVVLTGSTKAPRDEYMRAAYKFFSDELDISVVSPNIDTIDCKNELTYQNHIRKIKESDMLFVCNKDGYLGQQTKCDIFGAYMLSKPIAYWSEPSNTVEEGEFDFAKYIPHEVWDGMIEL